MSPKSGKTTALTRSSLNRNRSGLQWKSSTGSKRNSRTSLTSRRYSANGTNENWGWHSC